MGNNSGAGNGSKASCYQKRTLCTPLAISFADKASLLRRNDATLYREFLQALKDVCRQKCTRMHKETVPINSTAEQNINFGGCRIHARQAHTLIRDVCAKQTRRVFKRYHLYRLK